jgi:hypothetical protein
VIATVMLSVRLFVWSAFWPSGNADRTCFRGSLDLNGVKVGTISSSLLLPFTQNRYL